MSSSPEEENSKILLNRNSEILNEADAGYNEYTSSDADSLPADIPKYNDETLNDKLERMSKNIADVDEKLFKKLIKKLRI